MPTPKLLPPPNTLTPPPRVHRGPSPKIHETRDILGSGEVGVSWCWESVVKTEPGIAFGTANCLL